MGLAVSLCRNFISKFWREMGKASNCLSGLLGMKKDKEIMEIRPDFQTLGFTFRLDLVFLAAVLVHSSTSISLPPSLRRAYFVQFC